MGWDGVGQMSTLSKHNTWNRWTNVHPLKTQHKKWRGKCPPSQTHTHTHTPPPPLILLKNTQIPLRRDYSIKHDTRSLRQLSVIYPLDRSKACTTLVELQFRYLLIMNSILHDFQPLTFRPSPRIPYPFHPQNDNKFVDGCNLSQKRILNEIGWVLL